MQHIRSTKHRIAANLLILGSGQIVTWVLSVLYLLVASRYLGPQRLGELSLAASLVGIFALLVPIGTGMVLTRTVARTPQRASTVASAAMAIRCLLSLPVPLILLIYGRIVHLDGATTAAVNILILGMLFESLFNVVRTVYQGCERMGFMTLVDVLTNLLLVVGAWLLIILHGGVEAFAGLTTLTWLVALAVGLYLSRQLIHLTWRIPWRDVRAVAIEGLGFWAMAIFLTVYFNIDSVMLGSLAGTEAVGFYAPATRVFTVAFFVPTIVSTATFPLLSRLGVTSSEDFARAGRKSLTLVMTCGVCLMIGVITLAGPIITTLYGPTYEASIPVLVVLGLCIPFTFFNGEVSKMLSARDQQWRWTIVMGASCLVNPALNAVLIPTGVHLWHNGAMGAALALLGTEIFMAAYALIVGRDLVIHARLGRAGLGILVAGAIQLVFVWILGQQWIVVGEALGAVSYLAVVVLLGILPRQDIVILVRSVFRRAPQPSTSRQADQGWSAAGATTAQDVGGGLT